ncbi:hypothetical protein WICPIJ_005629 [Wickerhamomyces pijperi]|uniref:Protein kinase domain-containing protein n=1 Tax=Wickerhamomyces pijperi TaxID=599730 RepID=A0A9P8Q5M0_WICPI|nr:hypothetical protein WICPIJ_005629 [Wickerhamomyces pijperi]
MTSDTFEDLYNDGEDYGSASKYMPTGGFQFMKVVDDRQLGSSPPVRRASVRRRRSSIRSKMHIQPLVQNSKQVEFHEDLNLRSNSGKTSATFRVLEDFEEINILGVGTYGKVYLVKDLITGQLYAKKTIRKAKISVDAKLLKNSRNEKDILARISHPGIVKLFYCFHDEENIDFILEYIPGGEIFYHLQNTKWFSEDTTAFYMAQVAESIQHLHSLGIVYRDLKPENVLLNAKGHAILTDFGLSSTDEVCRSLLGTPEFTAPEVLQGESYSFPADWWSFGVMIYDMLCGGVPFKGSNPEKLLKKIGTGKVQFPNSVMISEDAKDLIKKLLKKSPGQRIAVDDKFEEFKKHRFFRKVNWKELRDHTPPIVPDCENLEEACNFDKSYIQEALEKDKKLQDKTNGGVSPFMSVNPNVPNTPNKFDDSMFKGFSFCASNSFIEKHFENMKINEQ